MFSLLLTLFICLFSYCPSINRLEDHIENNIVYINEEKPILKQGEYQRLYFFGIGDITTPQFMYNVIQHYAYNGFPWLLPSESTTGTITIQNQYNLFDCYLTSLNGNNTQYIVSCNKITIEKNLWNTGGGNHDYGYNQKYVVSFYSTSTARILYFEFYYFGNINWQGSPLDVNWIFSAGATRDSGFTGNLFVESLDDYNHFLIDMINTTVDNGYDNGYKEGYYVGYDLGYDTGNRSGYTIGYNDGYLEGASQDATASTIFTGVLDIALIPVNVFLSIFNFEVFGINISGIVSGLITVAVVIIIFRFLFGGKND